MGFTEALLARLIILCTVLVLGLKFSIWLRYRMSDKVDGEPLLAEEALVHDKSEYVRRYGSFYVIHFYIAARDTVVDCDVPCEVWRDLPRKARGTLTHQGGKFYSFETRDTIYYNDRS